VLPTDTFIWPYSSLLHVVHKHSCQVSNATGWIPSRTCELLDNWSCNDMITKHCFIRKWEGNLTNIHQMVGVVQGVYHQLSVGGRFVEQKWHDDQLACLVPVVSMLLINIINVHHVVESMATWWKLLVLVSQRVGVCVSWRRSLYERHALPIHHTRQNHHWYGSLGLMVQTTIKKFKNADGCNTQLGVFYLHKSEARKIELYRISAISQSA
jgi:hypothetical protein